MNSGLETTADDFYLEKEPVLFVPADELTSELAQAHCGDYEGHAGGDGVIAVIPNVDQMVQTPT
jgi:hypothetical protein